MTSSDVDRHRRRPQRPRLRRPAGKSGRKVLVLEAAAELGGAARTEEFAPGFRVSPSPICSTACIPEVVKALELEKHGLSSSPATPCRRVALSAKDDPLTLHRRLWRSLTGASPARAGGVEGTARAALPLCRHPEAVPVAPPARPRRHVACRERRARPGRAGAEEARQGRHARFPARHPDERRRPARRATDRRPAEGSRSPSTRCSAAISDRARRPRCSASITVSPARSAASPGAQIVPKGGMGAVVAAIALPRRKGGRNDAHGSAGGAESGSRTAAQSA